MSNVNLISSYTGDWVVVCEGAAKSLKRSLPKGIFGKFFWIENDSEYVEDESAVIWDFILESLIVDDWDAPLPSASSIEKVVLVVEEHYPTSSPFRDLFAFFGLIAVGDLIIRAVTRK